MRQKSIINFNCHFWNKNLFHKMLSNFVETLPHFYQIPYPKNVKVWTLWIFFSSCTSFDFTCIGYKISSTFYKVILVINRRHYMQRRPNMLTGPLKGIAPNKLCELDKDWWSFYLVQGNRTPKLGHLFQLHVQLGN